MNTTITISDINAGTFLCTTVTEESITNITYITPDSVTLTN
jgi:hypothetical protein